MEGRERRGWRRGDIKKGKEGVEGGGEGGEGGGSANVRLIERSREECEGVWG